MRQDLRGHGRRLGVLGLDDEQLGRGQQQVFQRQMARARDAGARGQVVEARDGDERAAQAARPEGETVGAVDHRQRPVAGAGDARRFDARVERGEHAFAGRLRTHGRGSDADLVARVIEAFRDVELEQRVAEALEQVHRRPRGVASGDHQVRLERQHLFGLAAVRRDAGGLLGDGRGERIAGEKRDRGDPPTLGEAEGEEIAADVDGHDALGRRCAGCADCAEQPGPRQAGEQQLAPHHLRSASTRTPAKIPMPGDCAE